MATRVERQALVAILLAGGGLMACRSSTQPAAAIAITTVADAQAVSAGDTLHFQVTAQNLSSKPVSLLAGGFARLEIRDEGGIIVARGRFEVQPAIKSPPLELSPGETAIDRVAWPVGDIEFRGPREPGVYTVRAEVPVGDDGWTSRYGEPIVITIDD